MGVNVLRVIKLSTTTTSYYRMHCEDDVPWRGDVARSTALYQVDNREKRTKQMISRRPSSSEMWRRAPVLRHVTQETDQAGHHLARARAKYLLTAHPVSTRSGEACDSACVVLEPTDNKPGASRA